MTVFGETGDQIDFRLYDHTIQQELDLVSPEAVTFRSDGYGNLSSPYVLNFTSPTPEPNGVVITLKPGWNWISYLLEEEVSLGVALVNLEPADGDMIKDQIVSSTYRASDGKWVGGLKTMVPGQGYIYYRNGALTTFTYPAMP